MFLLALAVVTTVTAIAQDNKKTDAFDCDTAYWVTSMASDYEVAYTTPIVTVYRLAGDTVVDGLVWKKMYSCIMLPTEIMTTRLYFDELDFGDGCVGLTRKDGERVYGIVMNPEAFVHPAEQCEVGEQVLLYDFTEATHTEIFCGIERKVYDGVAEGIGDLHGGPFGPVQLVATGANPNLRQCIVDDETIFDAGWVDRFDQLKYCYDMLNHTTYSYNYGTAWVVGRLVDGRLVSTYEISRPAGDWFGFTFYSDLFPDQEIRIYKPYEFRNDKGVIERHPDKAVCTIDGATRTLYDFGLGVGEVFDNGVVRLTVTDVDTAYFEGYERRVLTMDSGERWIDGIGSTRGLLAPVTEPTDEYEEVLLSCRSGDVVMYVNPIYGSGIDGQLAPTARAYVSDGVLHVTAATAGEHSVSVVAMDGSEVMRTTFAGTSLSQQLPVLPRGVYAIIVADGGEVACRVKVVL